MRACSVGSWWCLVGERYPPSCPVRVFASAFARLHMFDRGAGLLAQAPLGGPVREHEMDSTLSLPDVTSILRQYLDDVMNAYR